MFLSPCPSQVHTHRLMPPDPLPKHCLRASAVEIQRKPSSTDHLSSPEPDDMFDSRWQQRLSLPRKFFLDALFQLYFLPDWAISLSLIGRIYLNLRDVANPQEWEQATSLLEKGGFTPDAHGLGLARGGESSESETL
ncbi:hypothetical protein CALCODRAFT_558134 [Calocera cornea HHB12733]|uniref:Uncharacterized protein n=1 Tax=Calocera cornea HHB12733 TaxID=1353952 RepID=A0A165D9C0_9BASI|nr:hypothetical protein CALCODRAFT_558134 [Calocera cornea HHB12733]